MRRTNTAIHSRSSHAALVLSALLFSSCSVGAFHPNSHSLLVGIHHSSSFESNPAVSLIGNVEKHAWIPSSVNVPSTRRDKSRITSLHATILESGIESLQSIAIFTAVLFILSSQREKVSVDQIILDTKKEKETAVSETEETPQDLFQQEVEYAENKEDVNATTSMMIVDATDTDNPIIEEEVEEMMEPFDNIPANVRSSTATESFTTPNIDEMKRRVASTLASEKAKKQRLEEQMEVENMTDESDEHESKSTLIEFPSKSKKRSRIVIRIVKKVIMPWKKFSELS